MIKQNYISLIFMMLFLFNYSQEKINQYDNDGNRHGIWKKNFEGTSVLRYEGQFEHGKEVGLFKYYQRVGKVSKLAATKQFNNDNSTADVRFISLAGNTISQGKMDGKKYIGKWIYYHKNSKNIMTIEHYNDDGQLHGMKHIFYENQQLAEEVNYVDGKREGEEKHYSMRGTVVKKYVYENNQLHGKALHYDDDGNLIVEGQFKRDKKDGIWKYYSNGRLIEEKDYTYTPKFKKKKGN